MINLKAAIVGFVTIIFVLWLLYAKIKKDNSKKRMRKMKKERSKKKKI